MQGSLRHAVLGTQTRTTQRYAKLVKVKVTRYKGNAISILIAIDIINNRTKRK